MATNIIEKVQLGSSTDQYAIASTAYFVCNEGADTSAKTVNDISGFVLYEGVTIHVKFTAGNTASQPTLNVSSTGAVPITYYGNTRTDPLAANIPAGGVVTLTYIKEGSSYFWAMDSGYNINTTYTFSGGTNKITVTPSGGTAQDITITPSISNNITGSGTSGSLVKFNGANSITNGPALGTDTTKFLNNKGEWAVPNYIADTHYTATLAVGNANTDTTSEAVTASATGVRVNIIENNSVNTSLQFAGAGGITIGSTAEGKITFTGKAGTVTSIGVTANGGLVTNTGSAITDSGTLGIASGGVTNAMLANNSINIAGQTISLGGTLSASALLSALGIGDAVHYIGESSSSITDGGSETPTITGLSNYTASAGDIVIYSGKEFIWTAAGKWEIFGDEGSYALKSNTVANVQWDSTNKKITKTINTTTSDVVSASTLKSAMELNNVTNDKQIPFSTATTAGDIIYFNGTTYTRLGIGTAGQVLKVNSGATAVTWSSDSNTDTKVTQNILTTETDTYPLLISYYKTGSTTVTAQTVNRVQAIYVQPSSGTITATVFSGSFSGNGANITNLSATAIKTALSVDASTSATSAIFLHKSGSWKTISVGVTSNNNGSVVTDVTLNSGTAPSFTQGTKANATVNQAVLVLTNQGADTFSAGTYPSMGTISKANLSISVS